MFQGLVFAIFAEHSSSQYSFKCAREGPAPHALFSDFRDYLVQRCPALRGLAGIWARGCGEALCSAKLWFMHVGIQLKPEAAPE